MALEETPRLEESKAVLEFLEAKAPGETVPYQKLVNTYKLPTFTGGVKSVRISAITQPELANWRKFFDNAVKKLRRISPEVADEFELHEPFFLAHIGIFKAEVKNKAYGGERPSEGEFGSIFIIPQAIRYVATPSAAEPAYSHYDLNQWTISITAGTRRYLFGDGTNYYKARPTENYRMTLLIVRNGVLEVGTTPSLLQMKYWSRAEPKGAFSAHTLVELPVESGYTLYQYNTPSAVPIHFDHEFMWEVMPYRTGTAKIVLLGIVLFEYDQFKDTVWVA